MHNNLLNCENDSDWEESIISDDEGEDTQSILDLDIQSEQTFIQSSNIENSVINNSGFSLTLNGSVS